MLKFNKHNLIFRPSAIGVFFEKITTLQSKADEFQIQYVIGPSLVSPKKCSKLLNDVGALE